MEYRHPDSNNKFKLQVSWLGLQTKGCENHIYHLLASVTSNEHWTKTWEGAEFLVNRALQIRVNHQLIIPIMLVT